LEHADVFGGTRGVKPIFERQIRWEPAPLLGSVAASAGQKIRVGGHKPFAERRSCFPAQGIQAGYVEQLPRRSVRPRGVEYESSLKADDVSDQAGEFVNQNIFAGSHIEEIVAGIVLHQE